MAKKKEETNEREELEIDEFFSNDEEPGEEESEYIGDQINTIEVLTFTMENEEYGIAVMNLKEIIRPVGLTYVPRAQDHIMGIISLRGVVIPILNLKQMLGLTDTVGKTDCRYIIVSAPNVQLGVQADTVKEVLGIDEAGIEPPPAIRGMKSGFITGMGRYKDRMIILLNTQQIIGEVMRNA